jgi:transcriptional regulator with XRE-family HTH domain
MTEEKQPAVKGEGKTLGARLAAARKAKGYTQAGLARQLGIPQALISQYESHKKRLYADTLARLAVALDVSADELLSLKRTAAPRGVPPRLRILRRLERIYELPPGTQEKVLRCLDLLIEGGMGRQPPRKKKPR